MVKLAPAKAEIGRQRGSRRVGWQGEGGGPVPYTFVGVVIDRDVLHLKRTQKGVRDCNVQFVQVQADEIVNAQLDVAGHATKHGRQRHMHRQFGGTAIEPDLGGAGERKAEYLAAERSGIEAEHFRHAAARHRPVDRAMKQRDTSCADPHRARSHHVAGGRFKAHLARDRVRDDLQPIDLQHPRSHIRPSLNREAATRDRVHGAERERVAASLPAGPPGAGPPAPAPAELPPLDGGGGGGGAGSASATIGPVSGLSGPSFQTANPAKPLIPERAPSAISCALKSSAANTSGALQLLPSLESLYSRVVG